jgi:hypothetical protein
MRKFLKDLWNAWQSVQEERAKFYAKHGSAWE